MRAHMDEMEMMLACLRESGRMSGMRKEEKKNRTQSRCSDERGIFTIGGNQRACERHSARTQSGVQPR